MKTLEKLKNKIKNMKEEVTTMKTLKNFMKNMRNEGTGEIPMSKKIVIAINITVVVYTIIVSIMSAYCSLHGASIEGIILGGLGRLAIAGGYLFNYFMAKLKVI